MNTIKILLVAVVAGAVGSGINEIVRGTRFIVGENRVVIGQDAYGGFIIVNDINGKEYFRVQGGEVRMPDAAAASLPNAPNIGASDKVAQLIDVRPYVVDPTVHDEILMLITEATELEGRASEMEREAGELRDNEKRSKPIYGWRWNGRRQVRYVIGHTDGVSNVNLRGKLRDNALELNKAAKGNRGKAKRMQRAIAVSRQVVTAWNGSRRIVLISKGDIGNALSKVQAYGFFVWTGGAAHPDDIGFGSDAEHYEVRTVKVASRPKGWQDAP